MLKGLLEQNHCLICHEVIHVVFSWVDLFTPEKEVVLCEICLSKFQPLEGELCKVCSRSLMVLDERYKQEGCCHDCQRWEEEPEYSGTLLKNYSFYSYNDFMKEVIAKYKYRGDYILAKVFKEHMRKVIKELKPQYIIPIPLSNERLHERGFNQAEALIIESGLPASNLLSRIHTEKQSKKIRTERIHLPQVFQASKPISGKIVLVDDIYTTGSTIRHAAKALKLAGASDILSITIARG